jgi:hypothetical protein
LRTNEVPHKVFAISVLFIGLLAAVANAQRSGCDRESAIAAEDAASNLNTWQQILDWSKRYSACNEGAGAEGYSDAVVKMLAYRWRQLPHLHALGTQDDHFLTFVLDHIDSTTDDQDLAQVVANASQRCPSEESKLCAAILLRARAALVEIQEYVPREQAR